MCGIHGILALGNGAVPTREQLHAMGNVTVHRGPDSEGIFLDKEVALGMRRLSIIDVSGGQQPIANEDESVWVVCNGEIYNFRELREQLKQKGHTFRTGSDAEVIVHLYEEHGDDCVMHLDGMFGFALWDKNRRRLLIGRDRLGIKPLYYFQDAQRLVFASEAKSILALPGISATLSDVALDQYLALGYVPSPHSIFGNIKKLPIGTMMVVENGQVSQRRYWQFAIKPDRSPSMSEWQDSVREAMSDAVTSQMVSDVPLGAFLSGGIDSSAVVAYMASASEAPVKTYSIGFDTPGAGEFYNELPYARKIAKQFGTDHREIIVRPDVAELMPKLLWHLDEPLADSAFITTYLVSRFAREDVTVILSGVGGDELFGGYRRYLGEHYRRYYMRLPGAIRSHVLTPIARRLPSDRHSPLLNLSRYARSFILSNEQPFDERYRAYVQVFSEQHRNSVLSRSPDEAFDALGEAFNETRDAEGVDRLFGVDFRTQLPDDLLALTDKMSMATSIECRVPLLDQRLVDLACRMPAEYKIKGGELKSILKKSLGGVLPDEILYRKKRGFGAPMGAWIKQELDGLLNHVLSRESIERRGLFHWPEVERTLSLHRSNREDHTEHLLSLLNFELWARIYLDGCSSDDLSGEIKERLAA